MTKPVLYLSLLLALTASTVLAQDYCSLWSSQPADRRVGYLEGLLVGLKFPHTLARLQQEPESSWDAWQRVRGYRIIGVKNNDPSCPHS